MDPKRIERLFERRTFGIKPGLATISALLAELGNPQDGLAVVHVAGTNGKGSVSEMVASVLDAAGAKTGLYTSPHLVRLAERFRIGRREMPDETLEELLGDVEAACARVEAAGGAAPTFFECTTALCLLWWKREGVRIAVAETGMGGRLDATNVLHPAVCAITRVGMDHMQYLGDTVEKIALEKAGIAKPGVPLVLGAMPDEARSAIEAHARAVGAGPVVYAPDACAVRRTGGDLRGQKLAVSTADADYGTVRLALPGLYQLENAATAVAAVEALGRVLGAAFAPETVAKGLSAAVWPGRFQWLQGDPDTILDGGHNPDAARAVVASLKAAKAAHGVRLVVGQCADKDPASFLRVLAPVCAKAWTVPLENPRGLSPEKLAAFARGAGFREVEACASVAEGLEKARADARAAGSPVLVCGSLFLAGEVLRDFSPS